MLRLDHSSSLPLLKQLTFLTFNMAASAVASAQDHNAAANVSRSSVNPTCDSATLLGRTSEASATVNARDSTASNKSENRSDNNSNQRGNSNNKFRCRVAMACVHCRHRKIRCDGAQPSCYTCTRLQRKCEYERVSEQDNLLSRERKRLSRERKAARLAASATANSSAQPNNAQRSQDDKKAISMPQVPLTSSKAAQQPTFPIAVSGLGVNATPTEVAPALIQAPTEAAMTAAWTNAASTNTIVPSTKELMPWVMSSSFSSQDAASLATVSMPPSTEPILSLRSSADPSLFEMGTSLPSKNESPLSPTVPWADGTLSPSEPPFGSEVGSTLSTMSAGSLSSEATLVDPLEVNTTLETPLKLFSDQQLPSAISTTPSSVDTQPVKDTTASAAGTNMPMGISPLSPQLAPPSFDTLEPSMQQGDLDHDADGLVAGLGLYSSSVPVSSGPGFLNDLEPSSLPILSSWAQPTFSA